MPLRKSHRTLLAAITATAALAGTAASSSAASAASPNLSCAAQVVTSPFAKWGDDALYWLAPGGDFETGAPGWTLNNAKVVAGNESVGVRPGSKSLQLGGSKLLTTSSITTPEFCVDPSHPQFKFLVKNNSPSTVLTTSINFESASGVKLTVPAKLNVYTVGNWSISASQPLSTTIPSVFLGSGTTATITFRVTTVLLAGTVNIDNVLIDPYRRG